MFCLNLEDMLLSLSDVFHLFVHDACLGSGVSHSVCLWVSVCGVKVRKTSH